MKKATLLIAVLIVAAAPALGLACDAEKKAEATTASATPCAAKSGCPKSAAQAATLASNAESGCQKSAANLVAMAKDSGCSKTAALAAKAETGDEDAMKALIAMYKAEPVVAKSGDSEYTTAQLANGAAAGCQKSTAALIAAAKESGCPKTAALAEAAENGCEKSKAELIAKYSETDDEPTEANVASGSMK